VREFVSFTLIVFSIDPVAHKKLFENSPTISSMKSYFQCLEQKTFTKRSFKYWLAYSSWISIPWSILISAQYLSHKNWMKESKLVWI
jgi:hypothetical protein